jgi:hypothetical protein
LLSVGLAMLFLEAQMLPGSTGSSGSLADRLLTTRLTEGLRGGILPGGRDRV